MHAGTLRHLQATLNTSQCGAICRAMAATSQISLIQGPPGTGKTKTIIGLLAALFDENPRTKVLLCAPSNAAVDELVRRVAEAHYKPRGRDDEELRLIRLGAPSSAHHTVAKWVLDQQVQDRMYRGAGAGAGAADSGGAAHSGGHDRRRAHPSQGRQGATARGYAVESESDSDTDDGDGDAAVAPAHAAGARHGRRGGAPPNSSRGSGRPPRQNERAVRNGIVNECDIFFVTLISAGRASSKTFASTR